MSAVKRGLRMVTNNVVPRGKALLMADPEYHPVSVLEGGPVSPEKAEYLLVAVHRDDSARLVPHLDQLDAAWRDGARVADMQRHVLDCLARFQEHAP